MMLTIRDEQMRAFRRAEQLSFEASLVAHARAFAPRLATLRGDHALRQLVRRAVDDARGHGFDRRGPVRFWLEMALAYGIRWYDDPRLEKVHRHLRRHDLAQNFRADSVYEALLDHVRQVDGTGKDHARAALQALLAVDWHAAMASRAPPQRTLRAIVEQASGRGPLVADEPALERTLDRAAGACAELMVDPGDGQLLLAGLMLGFGHGVLDDPMYPWVRCTLTSGSGNCARRCQTLARKARWYLRATVQHWAA